MPRTTRTPLTKAKRAQLTEHPRPGGSLGLGSVGFRFTEERHGLTAAQCVQANQVLRRLERTRPIRERGDRWQAKMALRCAGILSAVRRGVVGSSRFGRSLHGHRGGRVMQLHGLHMLREIAPIGHLAAAVARERTVAEEHYEATGQVLAPGEKPAPSQEAQRIRDLQHLWEAQQWQTHAAERLRW